MKDRIIIHALRESDNFRVFVLHWKLETHLLQRGEKMRAKETHCVSIRS
jgi:hypothetical protein